MVPKYILIEPLAPFGVAAIFDATNQTAKLWENLFVNSLAYHSPDIQTR